MAISLTSTSISQNILIRFIQDSRNKCARNLEENMELPGFLSLIHVVSIILLFVLGSAHMGICLQDGGSLVPESQLTHQQHMKLSNGHFGDTNGSRSNNEEKADDTVSASGPTDSNLNISRAESRLDMNFGQAVVLAKEEAQCLAEFVSTKQPTILLHDSFLLL